MLAVDRYTKSVLTIIAACLLWICLRGTGGPPLASAQAAPVVRDVQDVRIVAVQKPTRNDALWDPLNVYTVNGR